MLTGKYTVVAEKAQVWNLLSDPKNLVEKIQNVVESTFVSAEKFQLVVDVDTGLGLARYRFDASLDILKPGDALQVQARGTNAHNVVEFTAKVELVDAGEESEIHYAISSQARGGLASVAQRTVSEVVVRQVKAWLTTLLPVAAG